MSFDDEFIDGRVSSRVYVTLQYNTTFVKQNKSVMALDATYQARL